MSRIFLIVYEWKARWVDKMEKKLFHWQIIYQYLKITATRVTSQNFIKLTISLAQQCTNIFYFSFGRCTTFKNNPPVRNFFSIALFLSHYKQVIKNKFLLSQLQLSIAAIFPSYCTRTLDSSSLFLFSTQPKNRKTNFIISFSFSP